MRLVFCGLLKLSKYVLFIDSIKWGQILKLCSNI